ncbi:MAG: hypothetical protein JO089_02700 [Alphaproteobacteria bacterium]|nr:hypothetical protein [Alphaproteobacteria bacterium]
MTPRDIPAPAAAAPVPGAKEARKARLAEALRANLRRRKAGVKAPCGSAAVR